MSIIRAANDSRLRHARIEKGLGQSELARQAAISRQALSAIEAGAYQPSVVIALRLAKALGQSVEALFGDDKTTTLTAALVGHDSTGSAAHPHVALARVGGRLLAVRRPAASLALMPASGVIERQTPGRRAQITAFRSTAEVDSTILIAGCDPAGALLGDWLARHSPPVTAVAIPQSSRAALAALADGEVHIAGVHIRDPQSGDYNLKAARKAMGRRRFVVVNFAQWEMGLAVAPGNPHAIRGVADLAQPGIRIVNRESGAGARLALDEMLAENGLKPTRIVGYARELGGHLEIAAAIANGDADAGITVRVAAEAYGLHFIALREERYDLVIPERELESASVRVMLETLNSSRFANEVSRLCAYDTRQMGHQYAAT